MQNELESNSISEGSEWYLAELVVRITVEGDERNVVHKNLILIKSKSALGAYERATFVGMEHAMSYLNPHGRQVHIQFVGLSRLNAIYDRLEDGAELIYEEYVNVPDEKVQEWVVPKHLLSLFRKSRPGRTTAQPKSWVKRPNY
jgi:hypothetical protein